MKMAQGIYGVMKYSGKNNLVTKESAKGYIAYFRLSPERVAIGNTEIEALDNLKELINAHQKTIDLNGSEELNTKHRKLWNY